VLDNLQLMTYLNVLCPVADLGTAVVIVPWHDPLCVAEQAAWSQYFLAQWPEGSDVHTSYWARLQQGPPYTVEEAVPAVA
jgi:hypothetical protein